MITLDYSIIPNHIGNTRTLNPNCLGIHENGWSIDGLVHEDYYKWVNDFYAFNPDIGYVRGSFDKTIEASSHEALVEFLKEFPYEEWDYGDI